MMRIPASLPALLLAAAWTVPALTAPALAGSVTVVNNGGETIRRIEISPSGAPSENRLRSVLPNGAAAQIGYGGGCAAVVRLGYESGRTEEFGVVDPCNGARVVSGGGVAAANPGPSPPLPLPIASRSAAKPGSVAGSMAAVAPVKAPPPDVPPWTGRSITKRFGGME